MVQLVAAVLSHLPTSTVLDNLIALDPLALPRHNTDLLKPTAASLGAVSAMQPPQTPKTPRNRGHAGGSGTVEKVPKTATQLAKKAW